MTDLTETTADTHASAGHRLGEPIPLEDLLALPPDGRRYDRDEQGRLILMAPDRARLHRLPLGRLLLFLNALLREGWEILPEPSVALGSIFSLQGRRLGETRLGLKTVEPDVACWSAEPRCLESKQHDVFSPEDLALTVEWLSPRTWRSDLGQGQADDVDLWRSYLESGVPEYWVLNAGLPGAGLPPRSALFLRNAGDRWEPLPGEGLTHAAGEVHGLRPVTGGVVRSALGAVDLTRLWAEVLPKAP